MARYDYVLIINKEPKRGPLFTLTYNQTRGIQLRVGRNAAAVYVTMGVAKEPWQLLSSQDRLFSHVLKKAMVLHLVKYSKNLSFHHVTVRINGTETQFHYPDRPPVFALTDGTLLRRFPDSWDNEAFYQGMLDQPKSQQGPLMSSLYALTISKSKHYQAERFFNLWLAMNGMYGFLSEKADELGLSKKKNQKSESDLIQMKRLVRLYNLGQETYSQATRDLIAPKILSILYRYGQPITPVMLSEPTADKILVDQIESRLIHPKENDRMMDLSAKGFVMMELGYYFRCQLFHANKPMPLVSFADEREVFFLKLISDLLEDFLETELYQLFDDAHIQGTLLPAIKPLG